MGAISIPPMAAHTPARSALAIRVALLLMALLGPFVLIGCPREGTPINSSDFSQPRIVSLSPAATQMLHDLGRLHYVVGVGEFDPTETRNARVVGDLYAIDYEVLLSLRPTDVLLQPGADGVPDRLRRLADRRGFTIHSFEIETLDDALDVLTTSVAEAIDDADRAAELAGRVRTQMRQLAALTAERDRPRILLAVGLSPYVTAAAPGTFLDDSLAVAGGRNALEEAAVLYPEIDHEQLLALDPDLIVYLSGRRFDVGSVSLPPPLDERLVVLQDPVTLLPSTSVPRITAKMLGILHPELAEQAHEIVGLSDWSAEQQAEEEPEGDGPAEQTEEEAELSAAAHASSAFVLCASPGTFWQGAGGRWAAARAANGVTLANSPLTRPLPPGGEGLSAASRRWAPSRVRSV